MAQRRRLSRPARAALLYALGAVVWIVSSDLIVEALGADGAVVNISKGFWFVAATTLLLWFAFRRHETEVSESVAKARDEFRDLIDQSSELMYVADAEGRFLMVNQAAADVLEHPRQAIVGHLREESMPAAAAEEHHANDLQVLSTGEPLVILEHLGEGDAARTFRSTKFPIRDSHGRTYAVGGISIDLTEQVAMQERLEASERAYRMMFDAAPQPLWIYRPDTLTVLRANPAAEQRYGYPAGAFEGQSIAEIFPDSDRQRLIAELDAASARLITGRWAHRDSEGRIFDVEIDGASLEYEGSVAAVMLARDIQAFVVSAGRDAILRELSALRAGAAPYAFFTAVLERLIDLTRSTGARLETMRDGTILAGTMQAERTHELRLPIDERGGMTGTVTLFGKTYDYDDIDMRAVRMVMTEAARIHDRELIVTELARAGRERIAALEGVTRTVGAMIEARDPYTAGHQQRVGDLAGEIGRRLGFDEDRVEGLRIAGYLHDVGKVGVPAEVLNLAGPLSAAQREIVNEHSQRGHDILSSVPFGWPVAQVALQHHERLDGSGYPQRLLGEQILVEARIVAVADVYDAITSGRPYRAAQDPQVAIEELHAGAGATYWEPAVGALLAIVGATAR